MSRIRAAVAAVAVPAVLLAGGCSLLPGGGAGGIQDLIEGVTGGQIDLGLGSLPADFPREVPLVDGQVLNGLKVPGTEGWQVTILAPDEATAKTATDLLARAGFTQIPIGWENERYHVVVTTLEQQGGWAVAYIVTSK